MYSIIQSNPVLHRHGNSSAGKRIAIGLAVSIPLKGDASIGHGVMMMLLSACTLIKPISLEWAFETRIAGAGAL
jgi:hypothetical protein